MTDPSGPPDTRPPGHPPPPPPPPPPTTSQVEAIETIADLVRVIALIAADKLSDRDPAARHRLTQGLRTVRLALVDLQTPARRDHEAAAVAPAIATTGGPVESPLLARRNGPSSGLAVAVAPARGSAESPPAPGADEDFDLPLWPGTDALMASLARRAD